MKVALHAGQLLQPVPGGIGRYVRHLVDGLSATGTEVAAFGAGAVPPGIAPGQWTDLGRPGGSVRYELWHRLRRPRVKVAGDLVHAPSLAVPPVRGRPLVVTVPDVVFLHHPEVLTRRGVRFHRRGLHIARREAAAVISLTEFGREELLRVGFDPGRVHVARPGVEVTDAPTGIDSYDILGRLGVHRPYLLFQSTIEPRKGLPDLLEAHRRLRARHPGLGLVVRGDPGWGEQPDLSGPGVHRVGRVSERELDALYRSAVALAHPARYEGFGYGIVEAMARGCPVVTTDASCLPEVAGGAAVLVRPGDVAALTDALDGLLRDGTARARLAEAGRAHAAGFTLAASAEAHAAVYRSVLA